VEWVAAGVEALEHIVPIEARPSIERWLDRQANGPRPLDPPWTRPGWFERASSWMVERMAALGRSAVEAPTVHYLWEISIILRAPTRDGAVFLKCSTDVFRSEAAITARLAARTPALVTSVIGVEPVEGWLLMDDHGDRILGEQPAEAWVPGAVALAEIQRAWTGRTDELVAAGARRRSLAELAAVVPTMPEWPTVRDHLAEPDVATFRSATPSLVAACRRLAELGPPDTIVHGDFHSHNVVLGPDGPVVFDWTDGAVGHPFVDLPVFVLRADDVSVRHAIREAYLASWRDQLSAAALAEAGELSLVVGGLYQVQGYDILLRGLDPADRADMSAAGASWLRRSLRFLRDGIEASRRDP
jgi:hypothetical protein